MISQCLPLSKAISIRIVAVSFGRTSLTILEKFKSQPPGPRVSLYPRIAVTNTEGGVFVQQ